jgi:succinoglycan biosynthesis transport protein ExoP
MDAPLISPNRNDDQVEPELRIRSDSLSLSRRLEWLIGFGRRQYLLIVVVAALTIALGVVHLMNTPPIYTAHAKLVIDSNKVRAMRQQLGPSNFIYLPFDVTEIMTQVELLKSDSLASKVIKSQHLINNPAFVGGRGTRKGSLQTVLARVEGFFGFVTVKLPDTRSVTQLTRAALSTFRAQRTVERVGTTYVLDIGYSAGDPNLAAKMANALADAYIDDQLDAMYQNTRRANRWLQDRIKDLRTQATEADLAVFNYKKKNKIVDVSGGPAGSDARLLDDDQVVQVNTQLANALFAVADAKARLERINDVMKQDVPDASTTDSLQSNIISGLRSRYLDLASRERIFAAKYGANHLAVVNLRTQMAELRRSMHDELNRIAQSVKSDYEIAKARVQTLQTSLSGLISKAQSINRDRIGLSDLATTAKIYHSMYDNFLNRYMQASQQESFPISEARVISWAEPGGRTGPNTHRVIVISALLGLMLGFAAGYLRDALDRVFRTRHQVEAMLQTNCLAVLPRLTKSVSVAQSLRETAQDVNEQTVPEKKSIDDEHGLFRRVIQEPQSLFAEGFRAIKVAADIANAIKENKIIGVTSSVPREGKSTVASNLAELMAHAGKRVMLVDSDLRNRTLSRSLARGTTTGLLEVLAGQLELQHAVYTDSRSGLTFLPAVVDSRLAHTDEILGSRSFKQLLDGLRKDYDYIITDLPPLAPVSDARATAGAIDSYIYVIEWGRTKINVVEHQLTGAPELYDRLLGVVLSKADFKALTRYEHYYGRDYNKNYYARYGYGS